jgi:hypothetical protein
MPELSSTFDPEVIQRIVGAGGAEHLHQMLLGISRYCVPGITKREPLSEEEEILLLDAIHHLEFISQRGRPRSDYDPKFPTDFSKADQFREWLGHGAPGLFWADVIAYLKESPIK